MIFWILRFFCRHKSKTTGWLYDPIKAPFGCGQTPGEKCLGCGQLFMGNKKVRGYEL